MSDSDDVGRFDHVIEETAMNLKFGVLALVEAKPGKEQEVWNFLEGGRDIVDNEPETKTWYAFRVNDNTFGIFDTFETEEARQAHLNGAIPAALAEHGPNLLAKDPDIRLIELVAVKQA
jgi:quinol monooxygenase YgiN